MTKTPKTPCRCATSATRRHCFWISSGLDEDLFITADAEAFVKWHAGQLSWAEATRDSRIQLHGPSWLVKAFPAWNGRSMFARIKPDAGAIAAI